MPRRTFLYQQLYNSIRAQIESGELRQGQLLPSERELGEAHKVDRTTVRRSVQMLCDDGLVSKLPGKGAVVLPVSDGTAASLRQQAMTSQGNEPAGAKLTPAAATRRTIGFFLPKSKNASDKITFPTYTTLLYQIEQECSRRNMQLVYGALEEGCPLDDYLSPTQCDGIIFLSSISDGHLVRAVELGLPAVLVNNHSERLMSVAPDNYECGRKVARLFERRGRMKPVILAGSRTSNNCRERIEGFLVDTLNAGGATSNLPVLGGKSWSFDSGYEETLSFFSRYEATGDCPNALFACGDRLALGAMRALNELGFSVPGDVLVAGCDNSEQSAYSNPSLTSVDTNLGVVASTAIRILLDCLKEPRLSQRPVKVLVPPTLVERQTTLLEDVTQG